MRTPERDFVFCCLFLFYLLLLFLLVNLLFCILYKQSFCMLGATEYISCVPENMNVCLSVDNCVYVCYLLQLLRASFDGLVGITACLLLTHWNATALSLGEFVVYVEFQKLVWKVSKQCIFLKEK